jgi:hypothetical protein
MTGHSAMSTDDAFIRKKKKSSIFWWIGGAFLVLLLVFLFQIFGPNPPIIVSPQTTFITKPLRPDGLPDYEKHILGLYRGDTTPENNASIPLLQLLFPGQVSPKDLRAVVDELGTQEAAPSRDALQVAVGETNIAAPWHWLFPRWTSEKNLLNLNAWAERTTGQAVWRPWTSDQVPPLAKWLADNKGSLDLILEASRRPRYFAPSPTLLNDRRDLLVNMTFPQRNNMLIVLTQTIREASRVLLARAMGHLGEGRPMDAWQDLHALHRLSRHFSQGLSFVEQSTARDLNAMACYATETVLHHGDLTVDETRQIHADLLRLRPISSAPPSLGHLPRLVDVDAFVSVASGGDTDQLGESLGMIFEMIEPNSVDWDTVLRETNALYDRLEPVEKLKAPADRAHALSAIKKDLLARIGEQDRVLEGFLDKELTRDKRTRLFAYVALSDILSSLEQVIAAQNRANAKLELTRVAAALAIHRAEHGRYPEKLDNLVPGIIKELPRDLFQGKPYIYQPNGHGYLLYSAGENGVDDGGRNAQHHFLESPPFDERGRTGRDSLDPNPEVAMGGDDVAIRVPRPVFEAPKLVAPDSK